MCGIAGMVHPDPGHRADRRGLEAMSAALSHRGPDDSGIWTGPGVGLAHRRLSVIDLSPRGRQPLGNEDGSVQIVFNGEIYNFRELREELERKGHAFRSATDTEVIVHLYEERGVECLERLDGMFALAIWDASRRRLLLARDRLGKKPLKYAELPGGGLLFASELKALLATGRVARDVAPEDLDAFLALGYVPSPGTGFRSIRKLPPAHRLVWQDGRCTIERYWTLDFRRKLAGDPEEWKERVRDAVRRAVVKRLVSDVPLGVFLSGGIDSSIVTACVARESARPVETFSVGFDFERYSELPFARLVAERYGTAHHEFVVEADAAALAPVLARLYEEPYADPSALPTWLLARETRRHVTVALNGDGGDEGFVGYPRYERLETWGSRLDLAARLGAPRVAGTLTGILERRWPELAQRLEAVACLGSPDVATRYGWMMRLFSPLQRRRLAREELRRALDGPGDGWFAGPAADPCAGRERLDVLLFIDTLRYLPDDLLVKTDLACMAHGLEARSPLLDPAVLQLAASAPAGIKYRGGTMKWLLREAFRPELPAALLERGKQGFDIPVEEWLRGPLLALLRETLASPDARILRFLHREPVLRLVERHASGRESHGKRLWGLLMLELWYREVVEGGATTSPSPARDSR